MEYRRQRRVAVLTILNKQQLSRIELVQSKNEKKHPLRIDNNHYLSSICSNKYTVNLRSSIERVLCSNTMLCYMVKQIVNVSHFRLTLLDVAIKGVYKEDRYVIWKDVYEMYWMTHRFIHVMGRFSIKLKGKPCL